MAGSNKQSIGSSRGIGAPKKGGGAPKVAAAKVAGSGVDRFRAASAAARARNNRSVWRATNRAFSQAQAAGRGYTGTVVSERAIKRLTKDQRKDPGFMQGTRATTTQFSPNRTPRQQRSIDRTSAAVRFYGLGTVTRGAKAKEFGPSRRRASYRAPATRLF